MADFSLHLQEYVTPIHYNVAFDLEKAFYSEAENFIYGICNTVIKVESSEELFVTYITLHAQYPQIEIIEFVTLTAKTKHDPTNNYDEWIATSLIYYYYDNSTNIVRLIFNKNIENGEYIMQMKFRGFLGDFEGFFKNTYTNEGFKK